MEENTYGTEYSDEVNTLSGDFLTLNLTAPKSYKVDFTKCKSTEELAKVMNIVMDNLNLQLNDTCSSFDEIKEYLTKL